MTQKFSILYTIVIVTICGWYIIKVMLLVDPFKSNVILIKIYQLDK